MTKYKNFLFSDKEEVELIIRVLNFLEEIGIVNYDADEGKNQYYFSDMGVANYYLSRTGATREEIEEILLEMLSLRNTCNYQQYEESLEMVSEPILINQFSNDKIDLRGMMEYAKIQDKKVEELSEIEKVNMDKWWDVLPFCKYIREEGIVLWEEYSKLEF